MGRGYKHGVSLYSPLNFSVVAYTSEEVLLADAPAENTIGIVRRAVVKNWVFSSEAPQDPVAGTLWIQTGTSDRYAFNMLKEEAVWLYPVSAFQYYLGNWVYVPVFSVRDGAWCFWWNGQLYCNSDEIARITGGWASVAEPESESFNAYAPTVSRYSSYMNIKLSGYNRSGCVTTVNAVDLTDYNTAQIRVSNVKIGSTDCKLVFLIMDADGNTVASTAITANGTHGIDISTLTGTYYVRILMTSVGYGSISFWLQEVMLL